jgi:hypothetical protein
MAVDLRLIVRENAIAHCYERSQFFRLSVACNRLLFCTAQPVIARHVFWDLSFFS